LVLEIKGPAAFNCAYAPERHPRENTTVLSLKCPPMKGR
jgi:hypothetical protein